MLMGESERIIRKFEEFLIKNDQDSMSKIYFNLSYKEGYYKINIFPCVKEFNSRGYFIKKFETERGQEKLAKFAEENNIKLVTY